MNWKTIDYTNIEEYIYEDVNLDDDNDEWGNCLLCHYFVLKTGKERNEKSINYVLLVIVYYSTKLQPYRGDKKKFTMCG